ncbi:MaoC/PaaZ C-terminal domain-containing protein [Paenarthrobacter aurescens]|uniref:MaoC/PaaZ C-terminal domain-containing protein n=1 Tax=Paenarthrobacter aurescens TaxID=43663 RepID=UPI0035E56BCC
MGKYFEDFTVGDTFITPARTITETDVVNFTGLSGDSNPVHTDHEFVKGTNFGKVIAHGALGFSVATGLIARTGLFDGTAIAFLEVTDWKFKQPIFVNDTVHVAFEVVQLKETKNPERGVIVRNVEIVNQNAQVVQSGKMTLMLRRRAVDH